MNNSANLRVIPIASTFALPILLSPDVDRYRYKHLIKNRAGAGMTGSQQEGEEQDRDMDIVYIPSGN